MVGFAALVAATAALVAAAWTDTRRRRIPHWPAAVLVAAWGVAAVVAPTALGAAALAGAACGAGALGVGAALWASGWLGGGDVKLAGALGLWLGPADFGLALVGAGVLMLAMLATAFALGGDLARRGLPVAGALAVPAATLLVHRGAGLSALIGA